MLVRLFSTIVIMSMALSVGAEPVSEEPAAPQADVKKARPQSQASVPVGKEVLERRRAELADKLKVEQVLLKGAGEKGVEIEISYRIVDAEGYAAHPKTTFIADEASSTLIPLTKLHMLFKPLPAEEAMKVPPARLTLWDSKGVIKPGQPVTVVVAGYGQKHLMPVAGPDYNQKAAGTVKTGGTNPAAAADAQARPIAS